MESCHLFHIDRGCRLGDQVSPFLFVFYAEVLGIMIRNNKHIKGIVMNNKENKLSEYSDDILFTLDGISKPLKGNATLKGIVL